MSEPETEHKVANSTLSGVVNNPAGFTYATSASGVIMSEPKKIITPELHPKIFNVGKADYGQGRSLFMGDDPGLFDTIHVQHPALRTLFREQKKLDWDENEVPFDSCNGEFKSRPVIDSWRMTETLMWQWETDSIAARTMFSLMSPFITNSEYARLLCKITEIEFLHAATYSEIVRSSFDDPQAVLSQVLEKVEALARMSVIGDVLKKTYRISHELALGMHQREDEHVYDAAMLATIAFLAMERVQFMASFAITFANANAGMFVPIGKAVQRICQDEYEIHVVSGKYVLRHELSLPCGKAFMARHKDTVIKIFEDVRNAEFRWIEHMDFRTRPMVGLTEKMLQDGVVFNEADAMAALGLRPDCPVPARQPLAYMDDWVDVSKIQSSPQEEKGRVQYKTGMLRDNVGDEKIAYDF